MTLDVERLAVAINDAQVQSSEMALGHDLRVPAARIAAAYDRMAEADAEQPCSCGGRRWVNDENWQPRDPRSWKGERYPGDGLIPCGFCNEAGWDTAQWEPLR